MIYIILAEMKEHAKRTMAAVEELGANQPDEGGNLYCRRKEFLRISNAYSVILSRLEEEANF